MIVEGQEDSCTSPAAGDAWIALQTARIAGRTGAVDAVLFACGMQPFRSGHFLENRWRATLDRRLRRRCHQRARRRESGSPANS